MKVQYSLLWFISLCFFEEANYYSNNRLSISEILLPGDPHLGFYIKASLDISRSKFSNAGLPYDL